MNCLPFENLRRSTSGNENSGCHAVSSPVGDSSIESESVDRKRRRRSIRGALSNIVFTLRSAFLPSAATRHLNNNGPAQQQQQTNDKLQGRVTRSQSGNINRKDYSKLECVDSEALFPLRRREKDDDLLLLQTPMSQCTMAMTLSPGSEKMDCEDEIDGYWDDEELTCNVCDRAFATPRLLEKHQQKRRHWSCNACERLFESQMMLEHHKEEYQHWSSGEEEDEDEDDDFELEGEMCWQAAGVRSRSSHFEAYEETQFGPESREDKAMLL